MADSSPGVPPRAAASAAAASTLCGGAPYLLGSLLELLVSEWCVAVHCEVAWRFQPAGVEAVTAAYWSLFRRLRSPVLGIMGRLLGLGKAGGVKWVVAVFSSGVASHVLVNVVSGLKRSYRPRGK